MSFKVSHVAQGVHTVSFVVSTILGTQWFEAKRGLDGFSIKDWCVEFSDEEKLAFLFGTKLRSDWPKDNIAAEVAKCLKVYVCADTVCGVYTVDMFEGHGAVVVGGDDFYASLSTLPNGAVIGAALSKDLFEKIAEEYGIAR